ncbi:hypothetical protein K3727_21725 (plasmid) [Rhodobacteraceae bacterium M382]|nr:hypothetical protein K3727_21725 [Rhodobacteraceae bacterium M382]
MSLLKKGLILAAALPISLGLASISMAANPVKQHNSNAVWFENWTGLSNAKLVVSAPDGKIISIAAPSGTPVFQLSGSEVVDGIYHFELSAASEEQVKIVNPQNNGRGDAASDTKAKPFHMNGSFTVSRGVIISPEDISEEDTN